MSLEIDLEVYRPAREPNPYSEKNRKLEKEIKDILEHCDSYDRRLRFFFRACPATVGRDVTGRSSDDISTAEDLVITAKKDGIPCGYADAKIDPEKPENAGIAMILERDARHHGIGEALFRKMVDLLRLEGVTHLDADLDPENYNVIEKISKWEEDTPHMKASFQYQKDDGSIKCDIDLISEVTKDVLVYKL